MNPYEAPDVLVSPGAHRSQEVEICGIPTKLQWSTMVKDAMGLMKNRDEEANKEDEPSRRSFQEPSDIRRRRQRAVRRVVREWWWRAKCPSPSHCRKP